MGGIVVDKATGQRISGAWVTTAGSTTISDVAGEFSISLSKLKQDTLKVKMQGYKLFVLPVDASKIKDVVVQMEQVAIQLNQVNISARRDRVKDSISNRIQFAKDFNTHRPKFSDIVQAAAPGGPLAFVGVSLSPTQLISALTYKHSNAYKFKQVLIHDEQAKYIDSRFSDERVAELTGLQNDSLYHFINRYRPTIDEVKKMSDYDIFTYIKKCAVRFRRPHADDVKEVVF
nr:carboxypeptidase-like regulatory domain-containing protein [Mucilaginibacter sp. FT3.2]MBB6232307.1 hypothetical protein [Mucilaginibacter sp. FT3.2]